MNLNSAFDRIFKADIVLFVLFCGIFGLYIFGSYLSSSIGIGDAISQGPIAASAVTFTLLSYRYTVKSNLRSAIDEMQPISVQNYRVYPVLYNVKWRSQLATKIAEFVTSRISNVHICSMVNKLMRSQTALRFVIYDESGKPVDARQAFTDLRIDPAEFSTADEILPDRLLNEFYPPSEWDDDNYVSNRWELSTKLTAPPNIHINGLHLTCNTTAGREVQRLANRVLRHIATQAKE